jgi:hypothetical protein
MVFDPCFTCTTDIGLVAHRHSYQGLQLVTKMRWEGENCHDVFLTAIECNNWQLRIMTLQRRTTARSL